MIAAADYQRPPTDLAGYDPTRQAERFVWDAAAAQRAVEFFPKFLRHVEGRTDALALERWQADYVATLFGWKRADGSRRYRESLLAVPRKNGKTTLAAGLALYVLACDNEQGAQVYCAAADRDQASLVYNVAAKMVAASSPLAKRLKVLEATKRILYQATGSLLRAIPADAAGSHGFNAHCVVVDELHTQPSRDLYDVLRTSMASRRQPLMISITTAGWDRESICHEVWSHARHVRDTGEDPHFLPVIYEAQDDEDWQDEQTWRRCNPCYGVSVSAQYLEEAYQRAVATPSFETTFKNLHLNLWTDSAETWLGSQSWAECRDELPNLDGRECFAALDLGATDDLTALVYAFPIDGKLYIQCRVWCATATVREAKRSYQSQYRSWADRGWLTLTPGKQTDYDEIIRTLAADAERYRIVQVGYDQWNAADLAQKLQDHYGLELVKIPQSCAGLNMGTRTVEEAVASRSLVHDGNPILAWAVSSSSVVSDSSGNRKLNKRDTAGKIDPAVAMVMACQLAKLQRNLVPGLLWV